MPNSRPRGCFLVVVTVVVDVTVDVVVIIVFLNFKVLSKPGQ